MKSYILAAILVCSFFSIEARECGLYLFGGGGVSSSLNIAYNSTDPFPPDIDPFDGFFTASNLTGSGSAGIGFDLTPWLGIQGDYIYWGEQDYFAGYNFGSGSFFTQTGGARTYSYGIELIGYLLRCCETINPFVKIGYARYHSNWDLETFSGSPLPTSTISFSSFKNCGQGIIFGAGISLPFNPWIDITFQAQALYTDKQDVILSHVTLYQCSLNLIFHFTGFWHNLKTIGRYKTMGIQKTFNRI